MLHVVCQKREREKLIANPEAHPSSAAWNLHNFWINIIVSDKQGFAFMNTGRHFQFFGFFFFFTQNNEKKKLRITILFVQVFFPAPQIVTPCHLHHAGPQQQSLEQ